MSRGDRPPNNINKGVAKVKLESSSVVVSVDRIVNVVNVELWNVLEGSYGSECALEVDTSGSAHAWISSDGKPSTGQEATITNKRELSQLQARPMPIDLDADALDASHNVAHEAEAVEGNQVHPER